MEIVIVAQRAQICKADEGKLARERMMILGRDLMLRMIKRMVVMGRLRKARM